jgi:hypothetical protein
MLPANMRPHEQDMGYVGGRAAGLPIGFGEAERGHRSGLQKRLEITGAGRLESNAEAMLHLTTARANNDWDKYWSQIGGN